MSTSFVTQVWQAPKALTKTLIDGKDIHALVLIGEAGLGKSFQTYQNLVGFGLKPEKDFVILKNTATDAGLYEYLWQHNGKIIVLDDMMAFFQNDAIRGMLMSALAPEGNGKRYISRQNMKVIRHSENGFEIPKRFEFTGKMIFLANYMPEDEAWFKPFYNRCIPYKFDLNFDEKVRYFREIGQKREVPKAVMDFVFANVDDTFDNFSFRTIQMVNQFYQTNKEGWQLMGKSILRYNPEVKLVKELLKSGLSTDSQIARFKAETGKSRATFFRIKSEFGHMWRRKA